MFGVISKVIAAVGLMAAGYVAIQTPTEARSLGSTYIAVGANTLVPYGWVDFCNRYRGECAASPAGPQDVRLTAASEKVLRKINTWVNANIKPRSDQDHWGVVDRWDYPTDGLGDCEDYVLLKRRLLIEEGLPMQALLVTVVKDERGDGHAVLTVKTDKGEFILDNLNDAMKPWTAVPYRFVKRQSQTDPNVWVEIGEPTTAPLVVSR